MRNDVYFSPGDKVMRVSSESGPITVECRNGSPQFGVVYCVEDFYEGPQFNVVMLVGFGGWVWVPGYKHPAGWRATAFRKVEEIKLCVEAIKRTEAPVAQPSIA